MAKDGLFDNITLALMDKILYFPYINVPNNDWTNKAILYWDEVGAIVPPNFTKKPKRLERHMQELVKSELVKQVFPFNYTWKAKSFDRSFIDELAGKDLNKRRSNFLDNGVLEIHIQKIGDDIISFLKEEQLATRKDYEWYLIEEETANEFMFYLVSVIALLGDFSPATDSLRHFNFSKKQKGTVQLKLSTIRDRILDAILPFPTNTPDPYQLMRFKDKYYSQLKRFRTAIELIALEANKYKQREEREYFIALRTEELSEERKEIERRLSEGKLGQILFGTICGLASGYLAYDPSQPLSGAPGLLNSIYSALQGFDNRGESSEMAYLALFNKKFGENRRIGRKVS